MAPRQKAVCKKSSISAYMLLIENHLLPAFGHKYNVDELEVQDFVFQKLEQGLSHKTIKDILIVFKMVLKFGAKINGCNYRNGILNILQKEKSNLLKC